MENIIKAGDNTIVAHLKHLKEHGEMDLYSQAMEILKEKEIEVKLDEVEEKMSGKCGCPGAAMMDFSDKDKKESNNDSSDNTCCDSSGSRPSELRQWPVQLHLVPPTAPYFKEADVVLAADCVAYSLGDFHKEFLKGKGLAIACPKLDSDQDIYVEKLTAMIDEAKINTLTVMVMQVPCCTGLVGTAQKALENANRKIPIKVVTVGIEGGILNEEWL